MLLETAMFICLFVPKGAKNDGMSSEGGINF